MMLIDVGVVAICIVRAFATSLFCMLHTHPFGAAGIVIIPLYAVPPLPTVILNAAVLFATIDGEVPKPDAITGAVDETRRLPPLSSSVVVFAVAIFVVPVRVGDSEKTRLVVPVAPLLVTPSAVK